MEDRKLWEVQGLTAPALAAQFGTPLYVYDAATIKRQIAALKKSFPEVALKIKFACKALTNPAILKLMHTEGVGIDAVSIFEARLALKVGFAPHEIMFTPSGVAFLEIEEAVAMGLTINLDNLSVLQKWGARFGSNYPCGLRLNPHIMAGGNLKISTGHKLSKFGISVQQLPQILELTNGYGIRIQNLHIHTGSEIGDELVYQQMAEVLFGLVPHFPHLVALDFGGGFKVQYKADDKPSDMAKIGKVITQAFAHHAHKTGNALELWIEPGKYLVAESGVLLTHANVVKETPAATFVGCDTGLNHLIRPMMYDAWHDIENGSRATGESREYQVVGNICETDTLGANRPLAEVQEGDILVIKNAGAYGFSMASNYNSRPRPAEVLVENGVAKLIRRRENFEDLLRGIVD